MPKTFTDDVAPAMPSALAGPFQVHVPGDVSSYFKLDPALARIEAAGAARPTRRLIIPTTRTAGIASFATLDSAMDGRGLGAAGDSGYYGFPFVVPPDMDFSAESKLQVIVAPAADGGGGQVVRFECVTAFAKDGESSMTTETFTHDWTAPAGWSTQDLKIVTLDAGSGYSYAGNKFESGDVVGVIVRRLGSAAQDTFTPLLVMAASLLFEYTAKQV